MINELFAKYCETQDRRIDSGVIDGEKQSHPANRIISGTGMAEIIDPTNAEIEDNRMAEEGSQSGLQS